MEEGRGDTPLKCCIPPRKGLQPLRLSPFYLHPLYTLIPDYTCLSLFMVFFALCRVYVITFRMCSFVGKQRQCASDGHVRFITMDQCRHCMLQERERWSKINGWLLYLPPEEIFLTTAGGARVADNWLAPILAARGGIFDPSWARHLNHRGRPPVIQI